MKESVGCSPCPPSTKQIANDSASAQCSACALGTEWLYFNQPCRACQSGKHRNAHNLTSCATCPSGKGVRNSTSMAGCEFCLAGQYRHASSDTYGCTTCPSGRTTYGEGWSACVDIPLHVLTCPFQNAAAAAAATANGSSGMHPCSEQSFCMTLGTKDERCREEVERYVKFFPHFIIALIV